MLSSGYNWLSQCKNSSFCCVLASHNKLQWNEPSIISGQIWLECGGWSPRSRPSHNIPGHNDTFWWPFIKSVWLHTKLYHHAGNVKWKLSPHSTPLHSTPSYQPSVSPYPAYIHSVLTTHWEPKCHSDTERLTSYPTPVCLSGLERLNPSKSLRYPVLRPIKTQILRRRGNTPLLLPAMLCLIFLSD